MQAWMLGYAKHWWDLQSHTVPWSYPRNIRNLANMAKECKRCEGCGSSCQQLAWIWQLGHRCMLVWLVQEGGVENLQKQLVILSISVFIFSLCFSIRNVFVMVLSGLFQIVSVVDSVARFKYVQVHCWEILRHWWFLVGAPREQADWEQEELIRRCDTGRNGLPETYGIQPVTRTVLRFDALRNWHPLGNVFEPFSSHI